MARDKLLDINTHSAGRLYEQLEQVDTLLWRLESAPRYDAPEVVAVVAEVLALLGIGQGNGHPSDAEVQDMNDAQDEERKYREVAAFGPGGEL